MAGCSAQYAKKVVDSYIYTVEEQMSSIIRNFDQMAIDNANICSALEDIKDDMLKNCFDLIKQLENYKSRFR